MIRPTMLIALFACTASAAMAQEAPHRTSVWGAVGMGAGLPTSGGDGIGNMAQLVYQKRPHHAAVRALVLHDLDRGTDEIAEVGALYGRTLAFGWGDVALATGVAAVAFDRCPDAADPCSTAGVPIVAEAALSGKLVGVGVQAFGNVNAKATYGGALIFVQLGWLP